MLDTIPTLLIIDTLDIRLCGLFYVPDIYDISKLLQSD